jgi:hypothetical protein
LNGQNQSPEVVEMQTVQATTELTAKQKIDLLAQENNLVHSHSQLDEIGATFSRLSDDEVELDRTQWLLVELNRAGILTGKDNTLLHAQYLQERDA